MSDPRWVDDTLDRIDSGWWAQIEAADAREESEHGLEPVPTPWEPEYVKLSRKIRHITYGQDEKNCAATNERQEAQW